MKTREARIAELILASRRAAAHREMVQHAAVCARCRDNPQHQQVIARLAPTPEEIAAEHLDAADRVRLWGYTVVGVALAAAVVWVTTR